MAVNLKGLMRSAKNTVMQFEPIEVKVREATSNDPWGPTSTIMSELARSTNDYQDYPKLFNRLWQRLNDHEHVMHVQKALMVVDYLLRNGAERFINDAKRRARDIAQLQKFKHYDVNNNDDAREARVKAKQVYMLLTDDKKLAEERNKASRIRDVKLQGFGSGEYDGADQDYNDTDRDRGVSGQQSHRSRNNGRRNEEPVDVAAADDGFNDEADDEDYETTRRKSGASSARRNGNNGSRATDRVRSPGTHAEDDWGASISNDQPHNERKYNGGDDEDDEFQQRATSSANSRRDSRSTTSQQQRRRTKTNGDEPTGAASLDVPPADKASGKKSKKGRSKTTADVSDPFATPSSAAAAYANFAVNSSSTSGQHSAPLNNNDIFSTLAGNAATSPNTAKTTGDIDFLSSAQQQTNVDAINDIFAKTSISSSRSQPAGNAGSNLVSPSSALRQNSQGTVFDERAIDEAQQRKAEAAKRNTMGLPGANLFNLDNFNAAPERQQTSKPENGQMSMSAMRSIQPLGQSSSNQSFLNSGNQNALVPVQQKPQVVNAPLPSMYAGGMPPQGPYGQPQMPMYGSGYPQQMPGYGYAPQPQYGYPPQQQYGYAPQPYGYGAAPQSTPSALNPATLQGQSYMQPQRSPVMPQTSPNSGAAPLFDVKPQGNRPPQSSDPFASIGWQ